jgi:hypothetical protein
MRAPDPTFVDAIDAARQHCSSSEKAFLDRVRRCTSVPPARTANDYPDLIESLIVAWEVANFLPASVEIQRRRREDAARKLEAIRLLREDGEPSHPAAKLFLNLREQLYARRAEELEDRDAILDLEYRYGDHLIVAALGRKRRGAGRRLFVRGVRLAMRNIFGKPYKPYDKTVGEFAGWAFETKPLPDETVRYLCKKTGSIRSK